MAVQFTIIGLHRIGASIGAILGKQATEIERIGNDRIREIETLAKANGAVDKIVHNLPSSVENADVVLITVPPEEIKFTLDAIAPHLKPGSVVIETSPYRNQVAEWVEGLFEAECYLVSMTPTLSPEHLHTAVYDEYEPAEDLFNNSLMVITAPPGTHADAIKLAVDLSGILGAKPFFADPMEAEGLMASTNGMPLVMAATLAKATMDQPSWTEIRKVAGTDFAMATLPLAGLDGEKSYGLPIYLNRVNLVRVIDNYLREMMDLRNLLDEGDEGELHSYLKDLVEKRETWINERMKGDWGDPDEQGKDMPSTRESLKRMFLGGIFDRKKPGQDD